jgi:hypothetical protein
MRKETRSIRLPTVRATPSMLRAIEARHRERLGRGDNVTLGQVIRDLIADGLEKTKCQTKIAR